MIVKLNDDIIAQYYQPWFEEINIALRKKAEAENNDNPLQITSIEEYFANIATIATLNNNKFLAIPLTEEHFDIDLDTRTITVPSHFKRNGIGVAGDHRAEILFFKVDRYFESKDLGQDDIKIGIKWELIPDGKNVAVAQGISPAVIKDLTTYANEYKFSFGWLLNQNMTSTSGRLKFSIVFLDHTLGLAHEQTNAMNHEDTYGYALNTLPVTVMVNSGLKIAGQIISGSDPQEVLIDVEDNVMTNYINYLKNTNYVAEEISIPDIVIKSNFGIYANITEGIGDNDQPIGYLDYEDFTGFDKDVDSTCEWYKYENNDWIKIVAGPNINDNSETVTPAEPIPIEVSNPVWAVNVNYYTYNQIEGKFTKISTAEELATVIEQQQKVYRRVYRLSLDKLPDLGKTIAGNYQAKGILIKTVTIDNQPITKEKFATVETEVLAAAIPNDYQLDISHLNDEVKVDQNEYNATTHKFYLNPNCGANDKIQFKLTELKRLAAIQTTIPATASVDVGEITYQLGSTTTADGIFSVNALPTNTNLKLTINNKKNLSNGQKQFDTEYSFYYLPTAIDDLIENVSINKTGNRITISSSNDILTFNITGKTSVNAYGTIHFVVKNRAGQKVTLVNSISAESIVNNPNQTLTCTASELMDLIGENIEATLILTWENTASEDYYDTGDKISTTTKTLELPIYWNI